VLDELRRRGIDFRGVLYAGLMLTAEGPMVLEFNVRFGDPETQAILPRLRSDLLAVLQRAAGGGEGGGLGGVELDWDPGTAVTVVLASAGYPDSSSSGDVIRGLDAVSDGVLVTHAGTVRAAGGQVLTAGGRVLSLTALGADHVAARASVYAAAERIVFSGRQLRRDIAERVVSA
jgi:phosphoribosylamine--glycine ligase